MSETAKREKKEIVISENRDFKGVWIPERLYLTREFTPNEKFLLIEIYSLTKKKNCECFANNKHFADFVGLKENTVQKMMLKFENAGYIKRNYEYREGTKEIDRRTIKLTQKFYDDFINETENADFSAEDMENNQEGYGIESTDPIDKNPQGDGLKVGDKYNKFKSNNDLSNTDLSNTPNSFSDEKEHQSNSLKGEQGNSFSGEKKVEPQKSNRRHSEKEMREMVEQMPFRARRIAYEMTGDSNKARKVYKCIGYFLGEYEECIGKRHKVLKDETLRKIVFKFINGIEIEREGYIDAYDGLCSTNEYVGDYRDVIDEYFSTDFNYIDKETKKRVKVDYSLAHFASDTVLTNIMNHVGKENWCDSITV